MPLTSSQIRQQFIDFFVTRHGHVFAPSSPVVPHDDPTLLFTNAGMNQFKPYFLGTQKPHHPRAANTQKCIRAGGKHNDLEDVGKDTYHHTFFEMLGNWSFGDYFKQEAIAWAWELLTDVWGLDPSRLHATYFQGDPDENLAPDDEARQLWLKFLPPEHVHPGNKKDNFWEMGDTGPCGPCSEIHIDRTPGKTGGKLVNAGDARVMEIWNLVFIQFNRAAGGKLSPLPARHVDTGMGFERICAVIASKDRGYDPAIGNYDTDVFGPIFTAIQQVTGARAYSARLDDRIDTAYRIIADHIRCLTFAITDGASPGNEGRNYVLRRILRRAVRHGRQTLNVREPFFHRLVPTVVQAMGDAFPELKKNPDHVAAVIREEEESFNRTIDRGIALFEDACGLADDSTLDAESAFKLHDTYGFPIDLTQVMAEERGMRVDVAGFNRLMDKAREKARAGTSGGDARQSLLDFVQKHSPVTTEFLGYDTTEASCDTACTMLLRKGDHYELVTRATAGDELAIVLGHTPFYAEAGGQVGDIGTIANETGGAMRVTDTIRLGDVFFHLGKVEQGTFETEAGIDLALTLAVDADRRARIAANHTMTHVMNHKLRKVLGEHVAQKGSLVDDAKTRFDFSHNAAVSDAQLAEVEALAGEEIAADLPVSYDYAPQAEALKIHGLRAVFGEKYPPKVRVVAIGPKVADLLEAPDERRWHDYSIEFCGGTHLRRTGEAGRFVIVSEEAVAKGVRRITAITGDAAAQALSEGAMLLQQIEALSSAPVQDLETRMEHIVKAAAGATLPAVTRAKINTGLADLAQRRKEYEKAQGDKAAETVIEVARAVADQVEGPVIVATIDGADGKTIRTAMDVLRKRHPDAAMLLAGVSGEGLSFVASVPKSMIDAGLKAGDWVRQAAQAAGGKGGGRPDMAQAGAKDVTKLDDALAAARDFAQSKV